MLPVWVGGFDGGAAGVGVVETVGKKRKKIIIVSIIF